MTHLIRPRSGPRWYVVQTHQQAERWAYENLKRQGYDTFLPLVTVERPDRVTPTIKHRVERPFFPGYLFVQLDVGGERWKPVVSTQGVRRLFSASAEIPIPVPAGQVERLIAESDARALIKPTYDPIEPGSTVNVADGPFADRVGVCLWSDETRVRLLMDLFGRETEVVIARGSVR